MAIMESKFDTAPIWGDSAKSNSSFKDELTNALKDENLSKEEATRLLSMMEERNNVISYTKKSANILVNELWVVWTDTWVSKKSLKAKLKEISTKIKKEAAIKVVSTEVVNEKENPFNRTLTLEKPRLSGSDVTALLTYLTNNGFDTKWTKSFGPGSFKALKDFQKNVLWFKNPDGKMDLDGKTMSYIIWDMNSELSAPEKNKQYWKDANEVVEHLTSIDKYLGAFNKVYGGTEDIISRDNGLLGIVSRLGDSSIDKLVKELKPDFSSIDKDALSKELGLPKNNDKFNSWLKRTAIIAIVSAILSGGSTIALELFAINYGENLKEGPAMKNILKALGKGDVHMKKEMKDMYTSKETTVSGVNAILDVLNNENMDTANLKRFMKEVYQPNWIQDTFGIFMPDDYEKVEELITTFEKTLTTEDAKNAVKEIYKVARVAFKKAEENLSIRREDYDFYNNKYTEAQTDPFFALSTESSNSTAWGQFTLKDNYYNSKTRFKTAKKELALARQGLIAIWKVAGRYTNLDAKHDSISGEEFNIKEARKLEKQIDSYLDNTNLRKISRKELNSSQSFGKPVNINKVNEPTYMDELLKQMKTETVNWETSVLSGLIRGVEQHYGISFTPDEFMNAFVKTAKPVLPEENVMILSNLGRDRNQNFQWKIKWNLFKININGTDVYFKDKCTNIVTVVNDLVTTVDSTNSIPVVVTINTGHNNGGNGWKKWTDESETWTEGGWDNSGWWAGGWNDGGR